MQQGAVSADVPPGGANLVAHVQQSVYSAGCSGSCLKQLPSQKLSSPDLTGLFA